MRERFFDCITEFIFLENEPDKADVIFVPGGHYPDGARRAAALYLDGYAPRVLPSGRYSKNIGHFSAVPADKAESAAVTVQAAEEGAAEPAPESQPYTDRTTLRMQSADPLSAQMPAKSRDNSEGENSGYETEWAYMRDILLTEGVPDEAILREEEATFTWENAICSRHVLESMGIRVNRAILVCQAFHARRCLMYYQEQFPDTEFLICPVQTKGISRDSWFLDPDRIDTVLGEVERCGGQFHEILKSKIADPGPADHSFEKWR